MRNNRFGVKIEYEDLTEDHIDELLSGDNYKSPDHIEIYPSTIDYYPEDHKLSQLVDDKVIKAIYEQVENVDGDDHISITFSVNAEQKIALIARHFGIICEWDYITDSVMRHHVEGHQVVVGMKDEDFMFMKMRYDK